MITVECRVEANVVRTNEPDSNHSICIINPNNQGVVVPIDTKDNPVV